MLSMLLCALAPQCSHPAENRIFDQVRDSAPWSIPNALAVSPDGRYVYCGEGGAVAIVDTADPDGYGTQAKRPRVSKFGARPAKILVDTGTLPGTEDDLLIICAGHSGLWVMDAHPVSGDHRAGVVDDSGNNNVNVQLNRRFCNDAVLFSIGSKQYVAATFGKKNQSRVRIHDLDEVRSVLDNLAPGAWTGAELQSVHDVKINGRPRA